MPDPLDLPFDLNEQALNQWLTTISADSSINCATRLNHVLNTIRKQDELSDTMLSLLPRLIPASLHTSKLLSHQVRTELPDKKNLKVAKLSLLLLRNLALAIHGSINDELSSSQKAEAIYEILQLIGQYLRLSSQFHELPSETLWQISGELYVYSQRSELLEVPVNSKISEFRNQQTILAVIKRNILFTLIAFHSLSIADNQQLYDFAEQQAALLGLTDSPDLQSDFNWTPGRNLPYLADTGKEEKSESAGLWIDTGHVASSFLNGSYQQSMHQQSYDHVRMILTAYEEELGSAIPSPPITLNLIAGRKQVCESLNQQIRLNRIHTLGGKMTDQGSIGAEMSLIPLDHEKQKQDSYQHNPKQPQPAKPLPGACQARIIQTEYRNLILAHVQNVNCRAGQFIVLVNQNNTIIPGIVRQTRRSQDSPKTILLIEKIQGKLVMHNYQNESHRTSAQLLCINEASDFPEVILPYEKLRLGSRLEFNGKSAKLNALLDYSPYFTRYRIIFDS